MRKQANQISRSKNVFQSPLEKTLAKKVARKAYYDQTVTRVDKWDDSVKKFRVAPSVDLRDVNQTITMVPTGKRIPIFTLILEFYF